MYETWIEFKFDSHSLEKTRKNCIQRMKQKAHMEHQVRIEEKAQKAIEEELARMEAEKMKITGPRYILPT
jgi:hypothetical protein